MRQALAVIRLTGIALNLSAEARFYHDNGQKQSNIYIHINEKDKLSSDSLFKVHVR